MPKKVHDCVNKLKDKGYDESSAWAICYSSVEKGVPEGIDKEKFDDCVAEVEKQGDVDNPYAVCMASLQGDTKKSLDVIIMDLEDAGVLKAADASSAKQVSGGVEYRGTKYPGFNKPTKSNRDGKKKMVLAKKGDKIKVVHYGDSDYEHNYSKEAKENFRARHNCSDQKDKFSAAYWACKDLWPTGSTKKSVDIPFEDIMKSSHDDVPHGEPKEMKVVIPVPFDVGEEIFMPGEKHPDRMKITLAYLDCDGSDEEMFSTVRKVLSECASMQEPLFLTVSGTGILKHEGEDVFHATVDGVGLAELRTKIVNKLEGYGVPVSKEHDFLPHITIGYIPEDKEITNMDVSLDIPDSLSWVANCVELRHNNYKYKYYFDSFGGMGL